jgi:MoaA/NifB/PqqE/SkfB family radical SAM enzyme
MQYKKNELTLTEIDDAFRDPFLRKLDVVVISGGEPFVRSDLLKIVECIHKRVNPYCFHITTNGFFSDSIVELIGFMIKKKIKVDLKISIDGYEKAHDMVRNVEGSFDAALATIKRLREVYSSKDFFLGINHTLNEDTYNQIDAVRAVANEYSAHYRTFIALKKRPLYSYSETTDYGLVDLSLNAKKNIQKRLTDLYMQPANFITGTLSPETLILRHYVKGQLKMLEGKKPKHRCMNMYTHVRLNPNGDIIPCSYDTTILGNLRSETFSSIIQKKTYKDKLHIIKKCGKCWLGCEVSPNWISSLGLF